MAPQTGQAFYDTSYAGSPPENYERYFVPAIGAPVAADLIAAAAIRPGERVLDVACGTGVVTRRAAERTGEAGEVAGLDVNPGMLAVARSVTPPGVAIDWNEASAEAMPFPDGSFDVALCQMGLQFVPDKAAALREMHRTLAPGGRVVLNLPGPTPPLFAAMAESLAENVQPESGKFVHVVFSLHDAQQLRRLTSEAGFDDVDVQSRPKTLRLPPPADFLWQYVHSTPLAGVVAGASDEQRAALEQDVCARWQDFTTDGGMEMTVTVTTVTARK
jgi:ubiquinone/menaquinone biosynthesis C-methylase UbiE